MELFERVRINIGSTRLRKKLSGPKRIKSFTSFSNVKHIGIVWDGSLVDDFSKLSDFSQKMNVRNIKIDILAYFPGKEMPVIINDVIYLKCFKRSDVNYFFIPTKNEVAQFINNPFDILIDLNFKKLFTLHYVSSLSVAKFKVGLLGDDDKNSPFDLMMEMEKNPDISSFLKQVIYYLEMINSAKTPAPADNFDKSKYF